MTGIFRNFGILAAGVLLAAILIACGGGGDTGASEETLALTAAVHSLEEKVERLEERLAAAEAAAADSDGSPDDIGDAVDAAALAELESSVAEALAQVEELSVEVESGGVAIEEIAAALDEIGGALGDLEVAAEEFAKLMEFGNFGPDKGVTALKNGEDNAVEDTANLAEETGAEVRIIGSDERPAVLVLPYPLPEKALPLIVSLHGFGGDSYWQSQYVPLHERVNAGHFALLLPNGTFNSDGLRFWNPTDLLHAKGESTADDAAYLTGLVEEAGQEAAIGPVYFFGYSNGGFMSYWMACKGLPGLRAVASLAGTSYVDDAACESAAPVSVLHIHGTEDDVILFAGDEIEAAPKGDGEPASYAGAQDMVMRWGKRAGCNWPEDPQPYASLDFDEYVPGAETHLFRLESGCAEGISIELWVGEGSSHAPGYGDALADGLLDWLLAQQ